MRRTFVLAGLLCLAVSSTASAAPLTLTYRGQWGYIHTCHSDETQDLDGQCSVNRAFEALGIFGGTPTMLTVTAEPIRMVYDGTTYIFGEDDGQIFGGQFRVGSLTYTIQPSSNAGLARLIGPAVIDPNPHPIYGGFHPNWQPNNIQFLSPLALAAGVTQITYDPLVQIHTGGLNDLPWPGTERAIFGMTLVGVSVPTVSVPEPSSLITSSMALLAFIGHVYRRRGSRSSS